MEKKKTTTSKGCVEVKRKEITLYFPRMSDVWPRPWSRASEHVAVDREDRHFHNKPPPLPFFTFYYWVWHHMVWNIPLPLVGLGQLPWWCSFLTFFFLIAQQQTTVVWYWCCSSYICRAQHCMGSCRESLHPSQTQHKNSGQATYSSPLIPFCYHMVCIVASLFNYLQRF